MLPVDLGPACGFGPSVWAMHGRSHRLMRTGFAVVVLAACSSNVSSSSNATATTKASNAVSPTTAQASELVTFSAQVWADNWSSLYVNGVLVGEDSVPITTERSFNAATISFRASYPLTIAMVTKDFKENDTGLEYIGTDRQQMGDAGFIAQIKEERSGTIVATTNAQWRGLVIHKAPTNKDCEKSPSPETDCKSITSQEPPDWQRSDFDDSSWTAAAVYTAAQVGAKDGYATIQWDASAALIWSSDLEADNTVLWRSTAQQP